MKKGRVVVGMSGGVDSSAAAALLVEQGYDVIGVTIKTYNYDEVGGNAANESSCCSLDGINDARLVCNQLGIPHYVLDFSQRFREAVIDPFVDGYMQGTTPNPCVLCNRTIKWEELLRKALALGADAVAMGHYARLGWDETSGRRWISRGKDAVKDQSYALWALSQESLARTMFPLAEFTKERARALLASKDIRTAGKRESYEICFIPDNDYGRMLKETVDGLEERLRGGAVVFEGKRIGQHDGYPFYTIGQRRGLNVAVGEAVFVTEIRAGDNTIVLGRADDLLAKRFTVHSVNMQKFDYPVEAMRVTAKIRYRDVATNATLLPMPDGELVVELDEPKRAVTPGQSTVWYEGDDVVGGGIIATVLP